MTELDIAEVAQRAGVPASTLRYYEEKGLIRSTGRRGLRRQFDAEVLDRLALIALGRAAGFALDEIAAMFAPDGRPRIDRAKLAAKADDLDRTIRRLAAMRDGLRHAAACPAPSHMECPTFRRLVRAAASGAVRPGRGFKGRTTATVVKLVRSHFPSPMPGEGSAGGGPNEKRPAAEAAGRPMIGQRDETKASRRRRP